MRLLGVPGANTSCQRRSSSPLWTSAALVLLAVTLTPMVLAGPNLARVDYAYAGGGAGSPGGNVPPPPSGPGPAPPCSSGFPWTVNFSDDQLTQPASYWSNFTCAVPGTGTAHVILHNYAWLTGSSPVRVNITSPQDPSGGDRTECTWGLAPVVIPDCPLGPATLGPLGQDLWSFNITVFARVPSAGSFTIDGTWG